MNIDGDGGMTAHKRQRVPSDEDKTSFWSELLSIILNAVVIAGLVMIINYFFFANVKVDGASMEPTLHDQDRLILNKMSDIERFDIVVFPAPDNPDDKYIKRVIGVPGDKIEYREDDLYLNGEPIEESYLPDYSKMDSLYYATGNFSLESLLGEEQVPPGKYFVLGDNRMNSRDSREFGFIEEEAMMGKVVFRYWPLDKFGGVE